MNQLGSQITFYNTLEARPYLWTNGTSLKILYNYTQTKKQILDMYNLWKPHQQEYGFTGNPTTLASGRDPGMNLYLSKNMEREEE